MRLMSSRAPHQRGVAISNRDCFGGRRGDLLAMTYIVMFLLCFPASVNADSVHLKNKQTLEGIVEKEDANRVDVDLGYGTMTFQRSEIERIERSNAAQTQIIWHRWGEEKKERRKRGPEEDRQRKEREKEQRRLFEEEMARRKAKDESTPRSIGVIATSGQIVVNTVLNGKVRVNLILDSGAGVVVLSKRAAEKLEIDISKLKKGMTQVADGRKVETAFVTLSSIKVQDKTLQDEKSLDEPGVEIKNVEACILTGDAAELKEGPDKTVLPDGLLGMSFLKNFKLIADYENHKISFERLNKADV